MRSITTPDGFTLTVHATLYMDWGLSITGNGADFYNPCCLSVDSYGASPPDSCPHCGADGPEGSCWDCGQGVDPVPWTDAQWQDCLRDEADDFIEAYVPAAGGVL